MVYLASCGRKLDGLLGVYWASCGKNSASCRRKLDGLLGFMWQEARWFTGLHVARTRLHVAGS